MSDTPTLQSIGFKASDGHHKLSRMLAARALVPEELRGLPVDIRKALSTNGKGLLSDIEQALAEREAVELSRDLSAFIKAAWHVVEPAVKYVHGWHIDAICEHLSAVSHGEIRNLVINMPPRHMKSTIVSVMWQAWVWTWAPHKQFLCASYASNLSTRDALKCRRLMTHPWYIARWGNVFELTGDQNAKTRYENNQNGYRLATSVGGSGTGEGGDILVVDDPHSAAEANSELQRETANTWWDETMSSRLNNPKTGCKVIVMQRLHENDLTGHVLRQGGYEHLCLPAEFEVHRTKYVTNIGWSDPRKNKGELLWQERFGQAEIEALKKAMGSYAAAGQLQQRPAPEEGGIVKGEWFKIWPQTEKLPNIEYVVQSYDTAFTAKTDNDPTAMTCWGVFKDQKLGWGALLLDVFEEHLEYPDLRRRMVKEYAELYGPDDAKVNVVLIEEKGSGIALAQDLERAGVPVKRYNPGKADKVQRLHAITHLLEAGKVWIPESSTRKNDFADWAWPVIKQLMSFPNAAHDDMVDTVTQALALLRDYQWIFPDEDKGIEEEYDDVKREKVNPYGI